MNPTRQIQNRSRAGRRRWTLLAILLAGRLFATAQPAGVVSGTDYPSFQVIAGRNIFDPDRYPRTARSSRKSGSRNQSAPAFSLVGTLNYGKGMFAFFDGTTADTRKVLQRNGSIAGYTVTEITQDGVKLTAGGKPTEMKIGAQMRQDSQGAWELSDAGEPPVSTGGDTNSAADETPAAGAGSSSSSGEVNDVLKKLMQQREQELK